MRSLLLVAIVTLTSTAFAEDTYVRDQAKFDAYKQRLAARRYEALALRREYNASKGPNILRTSTVYQGSQPRWVAIEQGWVNQPPIPMRPIVVAPYAVNHTTHYVPVPRQVSSPLVRALVAR